MKCRIKLSEPRLITADTKEYKYDYDWGPYQYPYASVTEEGYIYCRLDLGPDAISKWGNIEPLHMLSKDGGVTWESRKKDDGYTNGLKLPDGSRVREVYVKSTTLKEHGCTKAPDFALSELYANDDPTSEKRMMHHKFYRMANLPESARVWVYDRMEKGGNWETIRTFIPLPEDAILDVSGPDGDFAYMKFERMVTAPDGRLWAHFYMYYADGYHSPYGSRAVFFVSEDNGKTFRYLSHIDYEPDERYGYDRFPWIRGFYEPNIEFLPDGTALCLLRTHTCNAKSPCYICYSYDNGLTWTKPAVFDDELGVWPVLLRLKCGVTLASYGRPGVFLRATDDPEAKVWDERICVLDSGHTCSYTSMVPTGDNKALLFYTDFAHIGADGKPHKSLLVRTVEVL